MKKKPARPYADPSQYADLGTNPLPDYLEDDLDLLLCGINPGVKSAQSGFHCTSSASKAVPLTGADLSCSNPCQMRTQRTTFGAASANRA